jgi:catalase-peroxidase
MSKRLRNLLVTLTLAFLPCGFLAAEPSPGTPRPNQFWWPDQLDLSSLRQHAAESNRHSLLRNRHMGSRSRRRAEI